MYTDWSSSTGAGARRTRCQHLGGAARAVAHRRRACRLEIWLARRTDRRRSRPALCRNLLLRLCRQRFSRKRAAAAPLAHRYRADDALLHDRGRPQRHPAVTAPRRLPGLGLAPPQVTDCHLSVTFLVYAKRSAIRPRREEYGR